VRLKIFNTINCSPNYGEIVWTPMMLAILEENWKRLTAGQIAKALKVSRTGVRIKMYERGYKKIEMEYWTDEQVSFLKDNYQVMGDTELAEIFESTWAKEKSWTKKHIDKKRKYLGLKRSRQELINIEQRNLDQGRLNTHMKKGKSNFLTTGPATEGEIRLYRNTAGIISPKIRIGKCWVFWSRWAYQKYIGAVPTGFVVVMKDGNPLNTVPENLEAVSRNEATRRFAAQGSINLSDAYIAGKLTYGSPSSRAAVMENKPLIETERTLLLLKRQMKKIKDENRNRKKTA
jgi:hypothetical protein